MRGVLGSGRGIPGMRGSGPCMGSGMWGSRGPGGAGSGPEGAGAPEVRAPGRGRGCGPGKRCGRRGSQR